MFSLDADKDDVARLIASMSDVDFSRFLYCQRMASTFMAVHQFEHAVIQAMLMCDRVKVNKALGPDAKKWEQMLVKQKQLNGSTLGALIKILERHGIAAEHIAYLKWMKDKRDYFVHRLFHEGQWPGDLGLAGSRKMGRRLVAIDIWLDRASRRIWRIFEAAGLAEVQDLGPSGLLVANADLASLFQGDAG